MLMEAAVDAVDGAGIVIGWVRHGDHAPALVSLHAGRELLAQAPARLFRADLLRRGVGHGHYGFRARLRRRPAPGRLAARLAVPGGGEAMPVTLHIPALPPPRRLAVESLVRIEPGWTVEDVLEAPGCLDMPGHLAAIGAPRFTDRLFRFALGRWPADHERTFYAAGLAQGDIEPTALLVELLSSRERADLPPALPSPWDAAFPFGAAA